MVLFAVADAWRPVWKPVKPGPDDDWPDPAKVGVWTDDYSNLLSVFVRGG
jgi:hypothetical protein